MDWLEVLDWDHESVEDLRHLGYAYLRQGKFDVARSCFETLIHLRLGTTYDLQILGGLYLELGLNDQAVSTLDAAVREDPTHLNTLLNRTKALFALGRNEEAQLQASTLTQIEEGTIGAQATALLLAYT